MYTICFDTNRNIVFSILPARKNSGTVFALSESVLVRHARGKPPARTAVITKTSKSGFINVDH
ncbi:hypothetical protein CPter291_0227 [Collimonas pratensis]|uniref:Uncharacterized protein n=1 Tax=Collimonas pratensis TaxID=279113 RepID=A0ABN4M4G5_9BURK|nr:hypothetical protein CPter291_0227 [Collimonas pratensis]